jgi:hypothetical protein
MTSPAYVSVMAGFAATCTLLACDPATQPGDEPRIERVELTRAGGAVLEVDAILVNGTARAQYAEACGGSALPVVELNQQGTRLDTWGASCLANLPTSPVFVRAGARVALARSVLAVPGASYRVGIRLTSDPAGGQWTTVWADPVRLR